MAVESIDDLQNQTNQLYDEQMKQQENIINTGTQQAIDEIERNKQKLQEETDKTNKALYTDYQKQINPYGVNAENLYSQGLAKSGLAETTKANYYNTYQNARTEATNNANNIKADFDAQIVQARQNGDLQKAQSALEMYKQKINDLSNYYNLGFQANQFAYQQQRDTVADNQWQQQFNQSLNQFNYQKERDINADNQWQKQFDQSINQFNYGKEQDALAQSNWEKQYNQELQQALWEQQFNKDQFNYQKERDKVADSQWQKEYELTKKKATASSSGSKKSGSGKSGGTILNVNDNSTSSNANAQDIQKTAQEIMNNTERVKEGRTQVIMDKTTGKKYLSLDALLADYGIVVQ